MTCSFAFVTTGCSRELSSHSTITSGCPSQPHNHLQAGQGIGTGTYIYWPRPQCTCCRLPLALHAHHSLLVGPEGEALERFPHLPCFSDCLPPQQRCRRPPPQELLQFHSWSQFLRDLMQWWGWGSSGSGPWVPPLRGDHPRGAWNTLSEGAPVCP